MPRKRYPRNKKKGIRVKPRRLDYLDKQDERHVFTYEKDNYNYLHERKKGS